MNLKQILGLVASALGVFLIIYSIHSMQEITEAKNFVDGITNFFTHNPTWNPIVTFFGGKAQEKISKYDLPVLLMLISGIILVILGPIITIIYKSKEKKR